MDRRTTAFWVIFLATAAVNITWWTVLQFTSPHDTGWNFWFNAAYAVPFLLSALALGWLAWGWHTRRHLDAAPIGYIAVGLAAHGIAQLIWTYYNVALNVEVPEVSVADLFYMFAVLSQITGFAKLVTHRLEVGKRPSSWMSLLSASVGLGFLLALSWFLVFVVFASETGFITNLNTFLAFLSVIRAILILINLYRAGHAAFRPFFFTFFVSAVFIGVADTVYSVLNFTGAYWNGDISDGFYMIGALVAFYAVRFVPVSGDHSIADQGFGPRRLAVFFPLAVFLLGLMIAARAGEFAFENSHKETIAQVESETYEMAELLEERLASKLSDLSMLVEFIKYDEDLSDEEFRAFTSAVSMGPGDEVRFAFVDPDGRIAFSRDSQYLGHDFSSDPIIWPLINATRQRNAAVYSGPIYLLDGTPGFLIYTPVVRDDVYLGAAAMAVPMVDLQNVFPKLQHIELRLMSEGIYVSSDGMSLMDSRGRRIDSEGNIEREITAVVSEGEDESFALTISVGPTTWTLIGIPLPSTMSQLYSEPLTVTFIVIFALTTLAGIMFLVTSEQSRLSAVLTERTADLRAKVAELAQSKFYLDNISDAVLVAGKDGSILYANHAVAGVFGVAAEGILGNSVWPYVLNELVLHKETVMESLASHGRWEGEFVVSTDRAAPRDIFLTVVPLLDAAGAEIGQLYIARDISERKEVERAKTRFVSLVAHQLRAPMTHMRWMVEQLLGSTRLPKSAQEQLHALERLVVAESHLVGDLLNMSRIERGVLKLTTETVPVAHLISDALGPVRDLAKERRMEVRVAPIDRGLTIHVDREKISEAIRNVVDNAIKYSPEHSTIRISATARPSEVTISIEDQGSGIPEEMWDHLFDIKTTEVAASGGSTGAGLGLFLTKKFVEACGGTIRFDTSSRGTTFHITLPRGKTGLPGKHKNG